MHTPRAGRGKERIARGEGGPRGKKRGEFWARRGRKREAVRVLVGERGGSPRPRTHGSQVSLRGKRSTLPPSISLYWCAVSTELSPVPSPRNLGDYLRHERTLPLSSEGKVPNSPRILMSTSSSSSTPTPILTADVIPNASPTLFVGTWLICTEGTWTKSRRFSNTWRLDRSAVRLMAGCAGCQSTSQGDVRQHDVTKGSQELVV